MGRELKNIDPELLQNLDLLLEMDVIEDENSWEDIESLNETSNEGAQNE